MPGKKKYNYLRRKKVLLNFYKQSTIQETQISLFPPPKTIRHSIEMLKLICIILTITTLAGAQLCSPTFETRPECLPCPIGFFSGEAGNKPCRKCGLSYSTAAIGSTSYANCSSSSPAAPLWYPREIYLSDFYHANILNYWTKGNATTILDSREVELKAEIGFQRGIFLTKAPLPISSSWQVTYKFDLTVRKNS